MRCGAAVTMKQPRGRQEPRRVGNAAMVVTMVVSLCVLTYIKARGVGVLGSVGLVNDGD